MSIIFRKLNPDDIGFITSTWLNNYRSSSKIAKKMKKSVFFEEHNKLINDHVIDSRFLVACSDDYKDHILAWICYSNKPGFDVVHYVHSKKYYKESELLNVMIEKVKSSDICIYSHDNIKNKLENVYEKENMTYNPYTFTNENYFN